MLIETVDDYRRWAETAGPVVVSGPAGRQITIPCAHTLVVARHLVRANTYNPNRVPADRLELLRQSILDNGFAFPIVVIFDPDLECFVVVDGFHRYLVSGPGWLEMSHVPVAVLAHGPAQRMIATWQFNKARGVHQVDLDADLIRAMLGQGLPEDEIAVRLGIDLDTVHRYKQLTGIAELFRNQEYSMAWEITEVDR